LVLLFLAAPFSLGPLVNLASYPLTPSPQRYAFRFASEGPRGSLAKLVQFSLVEQAGTIPVYNLAFGDVRPGHNEPDDLAISANGDTEKVLATVAQAVMLFLEAHPEAVVFATGSTPARTRLYQMGLARMLPAVQAEVYLLGVAAGEPEMFETGRMRRF